MPDGTHATTIGILRLRFAVPAETLKEKRGIVRSLTERLRGKFNAGISEVEDLDDPTRATICAVAVSNSARYLEGQLQAITREAAQIRLDIELLTIDTELVAI